MSPIVAMRIVWLSAVVVTPKLGGEVEPRLDQQLRPAQVGVDARRAHSFSALISSTSLLAVWLSRIGSEPGQHDRNVAAGAAAAALRQEVDARVGDAASLGRRSRSNSMLVRSRSFFSVMKMKALPSRMLSSAVSRFRLLR